MKNKKLVKVVKITFSLLFIILVGFIAYNWKSVSTFYWMYKDVRMTAVAASESNISYEAYRKSTPDIAIAALKKNEAIQLELIEKANLELGDSLPDKVYLLTDKVDEGIYTDNKLESEAVTA